MNNEDRRLELQSELDAKKTSKERNKLGQFATPTALAREVVGYGVGLIKDREPIRFLDPAFGTGSFFSAFEHVRNGHKLDHAKAFEIDTHYGTPARNLWGGHPIDITLSDFTTAVPASGEAYNLIICNPPYVRHHHLSAEQKNRLARDAEREGVNLSGLAGLYCHFIIASRKWMAPNGVAGWLIPSEFMDVNYGAELKRFLLERFTLLGIHRFDPDDLQFDDALVSSAVVWIRNTPPPKDHAVTFTYGGTHDAPTLSRSISADVLAAEPKWTRFPKLLERESRAVGAKVLSDFFDVKRGLATGDNTFFIIDRERIDALDIPEEFLQPVLPSPRYLKGEVVEADDAGDPRVDKLRFLLNCRLPEQEVERKHPKLWAYFQQGKANVAERYLCRTRKVWYLQEQRQPAPIVCTYMGRGSAYDERPVKFILNRSRAIVTNSYLMLYPKSHVAEQMAQDAGLAERVWIALNDISGDALKENGRVYGGGLHKMEPKELASLPADALGKILDGMALPANRLFEI